MKKPLDVIQLIAKIAKILSKVVFVFSIIGASLCLVGIVSLAVGLDAVLKLGDINIMGLIENTTELTDKQMIGAMAVGMIMLIGEIPIAHYSWKYFKNELDAMTPFTYDGASEIMRLGIITMAISLGVSVAASIVLSVLGMSDSAVSEIKTDPESSIILGAMFLLLSVIFKYGAQLREKVNDSIVPEEKGE